MNPHPSASESPPPEHQVADQPHNYASAVPQMSDKFPHPKRQKLNSLSAVALGGDGVARPAKGVSGECLTTVRPNSSFRSSPSPVSSSSASLSRFLSNHLASPPPPPQLKHHQLYAGNSPSSSATCFNQQQQQQPPHERQWTIVKNTASQCTSYSSPSFLPNTTTSPSSGGGAGQLRISLLSSPSSLRTAPANTLNCDDPRNVRSSADKPAFTSPQLLKASPLTTSGSSSGAVLNHRSFSESSTAAMLSPVSHPTPPPSKAYQQTTSPTARITPTITPVVKDETAVKHASAPPQPTSPSPHQRSLPDPPQPSKEPNRLMKSLSQPPQPLVPQQHQQSMEQRTSPTLSQPVVQQAPRKSFACLRNLGSTCYINCIIQVMRYTPGFVLSIHKLHRQIEYLKSMVSRQAPRQLTLTPNDLDPE